MVEKINLYHSLPSASPNNIPCFPSPLVLFFPLNFKDTKHCLALNKIYISSYQTGWASCQCFFLTVEMPFFFFLSFPPFFFNRKLLKLLCFTEMYTNTKWANRGFVTKYELWNDYGDQEIEKCRHLRVSCSLHFK